MPTDSFKNMNAALQQSYDIKHIYYSAILLLGQFLIYDVLRTNWFIMLQMYSQLCFFLRTDKRKSEIVRETVL